MREIKVMTMGQVGTGYFVADVDDDYELDTVVPADHYDADEQDWNRVRSIRGHADIATYTLEYYNGETHVAKWQSSATVWVLCENGQPVVQDEPNGPID